MSSSPFLHKFLGALLLLVGISVTQEARATHLVGGEITYTFEGVSLTGLAMYEVHLFIYRDCSSANTNGTGFDALATVWAFQNGAFVEDALGSLDFSTVENIIPQDPNSCAELPDDLCIERAEYVMTMFLEPSSQPYQLSYQRCCRSPAITNLTDPENQGFTLGVTIPGGMPFTDPVGGGEVSNSSPSFNALPQAFVCNQTPFSLDNGALDQDGDSLVYSLCPIFLGGTFMDPIPVTPDAPPYSEVNWSAGYGPPQPLGSGAGMTIDSQTGLLTGTPLQVGKYALGVMVEEWRDGVQIGSVYRDFTLDVVNCNILAPSYESLDPCAGMEVMFNQLAQPAELYVWDFGDPSTTGDVSSEAEPSYTYPEPGIYTASLFFQSGSCSDSVAFDVVAQSDWSISLEAATRTCSEGGWDVVFDAVTGYPDGASVLWAFSVGADPISWSGVDPPPAIWFPPGATAYATVITESYGCERLAYWSAPLDALPQAEFDVISEPCAGLEVAFAQSGATTNASFTWDFGGTGTLLNVPNPTWTFPAYGDYFVSLIASPGSSCADTLSVPVTVSPHNPFDFTYSTFPASLCDSAGVVLAQLLGGASSGSDAPGGADLITWEFPVAAASPQSGASAVFDFSSPGTYLGSLTVYNAFCDTTAVIGLEVVVPEPLTAVEYLLPNVFSPNNDGKNEWFNLRLIGADGFPETSISPTWFDQWDFRIYDRWGNLSFHSSDAARGWRADGSAEGTYYVIATVKHVCDTAPQSFSSPVTVVR